MNDQNKIKNTFPWGKIRQIYSVGNYHIVEGEDNLFYPYIGTRSINRNYPSIDAALVGVIAVNHSGASTQADLYACKILDLM